MTDAGKRVTEARTLFGVPLESKRQRAVVLREPTRPRAPRGVGPSSDVTRVRHLAAAAVGAVAAFAAAWGAAPAPAARAIGALALPHREAQVACESCHGEAREDDPRDACVSCHGPHRSRRAGHRKLARRGELGCVDCHDVHGTDGGLRLRPLGGDAVPPAVRYWVGGEAPAALTAPHLARPATVPLVPLSNCARCHRPDDPRDPIGACWSGDEGGPADGAVATCFDEHAHAMEPARGAGVCRGQHGADRFIAWEAAREAAAAPAPELRREAPRQPLWWTLAGLLGAVLGGLGSRGLQRMRRRRAEARPVPAPPAAPTRRYLPQIDTSTCLGCYACVDACPYDVLTVQRYVAEVQSPEACCGLTACEKVCPNGSLVVRAGDAITGRLRLDDDHQSLDNPGVYLAGNVTGVPLIKNAIVQGAAAVDGIAASLDGGHDAALDLVIVGAGPAGISAALRAKELGLEARVIDQGSVAQSIRSFPRGKLVFDQPLDLPRVGALWLEESTKEELLDKWLRVVRREKLDIVEQRRFVGLEGAAGAFVVRTEQVPDGAAQTLSAARVLLAIGMRGAPRKLPLELDARTEARVHYHLADARSFADQRVVVVGLGDVAMETAIAIAGQLGSEVDVVHRGEGFTRGKARNVAELERLAGVGRVRLHFASHVTRVDDRRVAIETRRDGEELQESELEADAVFVMIGAVAPDELLARAGVTRD